MPKIFQTTLHPAKGSSENAACARKNAKILSLPKPDLFFVCLTKGLRYHADLLQNC